jgi:preprotein translocase subunit SecB
VLATPGRRRLGGFSHPDPAAETNMNTPVEGAADGKLASLNVLAQYIKDLSFESPNAPNFGMPPGQAPTLNIQINVTAKPLSETEYAVDLTVEGKAEHDKKVLFAIELVYGGVFRIQNVPKESIHPLVLIECPRLLFPFARQIVADTVRDGGFPPLMIDPVDFAALYRQRAEQVQPTSPPN